MGNWKPKIKQTELIQKCLEQIESETGFHIDKTDYSDGYWSTGVDNSSCVFHIKEIPKFTFGIWLVDTCAGTKKERAKYLMDSDREPIWTDYIGIRADSDLVIFTQYTRDIDKFKPSRSGFVIGIKRNSWISKVEDKVIKEDGLFYLGDVVDCLKYMKKHPIKSYYYTGSMTDYIWNSTSTLKILRCYIREAIDAHKYKSKKKRKEKKLIKISKRFLKKLTQFNYTLEKELCCYPSIHIRIRRKDNINYNKYNMEYNRIEKFIDKYSSPMWIDMWEVPLQFEEFTIEERNEDNNLKERFEKGTEARIKGKIEDIILLKYTYDKEVDRYGKEK